jgi:hypothetical protein
VAPLARPSSTCTVELQTRPLLKMVVPQEENCKYLKIFFMEVKEEFLAGPEFRPDTKIH